MAHGHNNTSTQGMHMPALVLIAVVGAILTYVSVVALQGFYQSAVIAEEQTKLIAKDYEPLTDMKKDHTDYLTSDPSWVDEEAGIARVPIEVGKQQVIEQFGRDSH